MPERDVPAAPAAMRGLVDSTADNAEPAFASDPAVMLLLLRCGGRREPRAEEDVEDEEEDEEDTALGRTGDLTEGDVRASGGEAGEEDALLAGVELARDIAG